MDVLNNELSWKEDLRRVKMILLETQQEDMEVGTEGQPTGSQTEKFTLLKKDVHTKVKHIRKAIQDRDQLLEQKAGSKQTVEMSAQIRREIQGVKDSANEMKRLQRAKAAQGTNLQETEHQADVVSLVFEHIQECESMEKQRYADKHSEARVNLFSGSRQGAGGGGAAVPYVRMAEPTSSNLPDIDDDTKEGLQQLQHKNQEIDQGLSEVHDGIKVLKNLAEVQRDEINVQRSMISELGSNVDRTAQHMSSTNKRMKQTLVSMRSADRFMIDMILLVFIMGLISYIYNMVSW